MKKTLLATLLALTMLLGGASAAIAGPDHRPGAKDNGKNSYGQCTAFFNGQKKGHSRDGYTIDDVEDYYDFCLANGHPSGRDDKSGIGGQGAGDDTNGRFICDAGDPDDPDDTTCTNS